MRETLHQLTLTLALPIAVGAVWIARAERAEPPVRERATAYRVELADLPLPVRERLRTPGFAAPMPVARKAPEDSAPRRERPMLEGPSQPAPAPVQLAVETDSKRDVVAAPSPRAAEKTLGALPRASQAALRTAPPIALAAPSLSSRRGTAPAATVPVAPSEVAAPPQIAAVTGIGKAASRAPAAGADPNAWKQDRLRGMQAALSASPRSPQLLGGRGAGAAPVAAPARAVGKSPIVSGDVGRSSPIATRDAREPSSIVTGDVGKSSPVAATPIGTGDVGKPSPIASQRVEIDPGRREGSGIPGGRAPEVRTSEGRTPLWSSRPIDRVEDFSLPISDLPRYEPEPVKTVTPVDLEPEISESTPIVQWFPPRLLVLTPEPGSAILLGVSLAALGTLRRSRRRM